MGAWADLHSVLEGLGLIMRCLTDAAVHDKDDQVRLSHRCHLRRCWHMLTALVMTRQAENLGMP